MDFSWQRTFTRPTWHSFARSETGHHWDRYCEFGPDLAVEILSPDDNAARLQRKIARYLGAGTSIVWVLDLDSLSIHVYQKPGVFRTLTADDRIDAPELLPGFSIAVRTLFE